MKFKDVAHLYNDVAAEGEYGSIALMDNGLTIIKQNEELHDFFKPILRQLTSLTEFERARLREVCEYTLVEFTKDTTIQLGAKAYLYLLWLRIDLFGLIESGEAIDAETLNEYNPYAEGSPYYKR